MLSEQFYTALVFPLLLLIGQALVALGQRKISQRMDEGQAKTDAKREAEAKWRDEMDVKVDNLTAATQANMRTNLCHLYEKYMTRGWLTSEEHTSWHNMHEMYAALNANGLIDSYAERIDQLPHREI